MTTHLFDVKSMDILQTSFRYTVRDSFRTFCTSYFLPFWWSTWSEYHNIIPPFHFQSKNKSSVWKPTWVIWVFMPTKSALLWLLPCPEKVGEKLVRFHYKYWEDCQQKGNYYNLFWLCICMYFTYKYMLKMQTLKMAVWLFFFQKVSNIFLF